MALKKQEIDERELKKIIFDKLSVDNKHMIIDGKTIYINKAIRATSEETRKGMVYEVFNAGADEYYPIKGSWLLGVISKALDE